MSVPDLVKLDFPDRDLYILKDGDWRGYRSAPCAKEPETVEWIRSFEKGSVFWDVGASVGPYSLIAAALGHSVIAFEPFYPSLGHLQQNAWLNRFGEQLRCLPYALADPPALVGLNKFAVSSPMPGSASHGGNDKTRETQFKLYTSADTQSGQVKLPDHVKIDVDGGELSVIEGGRETWKRVQSIMVESEPPTIDSITVILQAAGLELVDSWKRLGDTKQRNYLYRRA